MRFMPHDTILVARKQINKSIYMYGSPKKYLTRSQNAERKIESCRKTGNFMKDGGISRRSLVK